MSVVAEIIRIEADGAISFGNHTLSEKTKKEDFEHNGDLYKVKTYSTMTKMEKNGLFVYESVPGTSVNSFCESADGVKLSVEGADDAQLTLGLLEDTEYEVFVDGVSCGKMKTNLSGKLSVSVELQDKGSVEVVIKR